MSIYKTVLVQKLMTPTQIEKECTGGFDLVCFALVDFSLFLGEPTGKVYEYIFVKDN